MVLGGSDSVAADPYHAPLRLDPPLVSFIALFGSRAVRLPLCRACHAVRSPATLVHGRNGTANPHCSSTTRRNDGTSVANTPMLNRGRREEFAARRLAEERGVPQPPDGKGQPETGGRSCTRAQPQPGCEAAARRQTRQKWDRARQPLSAGAVVRLPRPPFPPPSGLPNTRDKLRGAHDPMMGLQPPATPVELSTVHSPLLRPPPVSFIALFGSAPALRVAVRGGLTRLT